MRQALAWLEIQNRVSSKPIRTILGSDAYQLEKSRKALAAFRARVRKALGRKRTTSKTEITLNVPRKEVTAFQHCYDGHAMCMRMNRASGQTLALREDIAKSTKPRGRPKLTSTQRAGRLSKKYHIGDRQKHRIRKTERIAKRDAEWSRGLRQRGETILTYTVGRPKS